MFKFNSKSISIASITLLAIVGLSGCSADSTSDSPRPAPPKPTTSVFEKHALDLIHSEGGAGVRPGQIRGVARAVCVDLAKGGTLDSIAETISNQHVSISDERVRQFWTIQYLQKVGCPDTPVPNPDGFEDAPRLDELVPEGTAESK